MSNLHPALAVRGDLLQTPSPTTLDVQQQVVVSVAGDGRILDVDPVESDAGRSAVETADEVVHLDRSQRLLPGLIDTHIHAPQWPQLGTGLDIGLEQ
ncbi:MAG: hypothetical protein F2873_02855, partial [Actinobacteria bacterium]|nr:hypothetical protein [Actinomycetota bacterium]